MTTRTTRRPTGTAIKKTIAAGTDQIAAKKIAADDGTTGTVTN